MNEHHNHSVTTLHFVILFLILFILLSGSRLFRQLAI